MAELATIVSDLMKGKKTSENLPLYISGLKSLYNRMAHMRLALNYYTFSEMYYELSKDLKEVCKDEVDFLQKIVKEVVLDGVYSDATEKSMEEFRNGIISKVETITGYTDKLQIFEYILNRVEFRFNESEYDLEYYNNDFERDIYNYVVGDRDNAGVNMRLSMVMGELPMRLSKNKFFDVLCDSFSIYKGSEKKSVDDFMYRVRTAAAVYEINADKSFRGLEKALDEFKSVDYQNITKEQFDLMRDKMDGVIDLATSYSDIFVVIMEILNDVYSILLCKDSLFDVAEREGLLEITEYCYGVIEGDNEPDFSVAEKFVEYEGLQEKIAMMVNAPESALMEIYDANRKVIEQLQKDADMKVLERIGLLQSGSVFVTFDADDSKKEEADEKYIKELTDDLISDLTKVFEENGRLYNRAVMATVISNLPAYFNNIKEFEEYVHVSLSQCNDEAEQKACMTLINMMMASE